MIETQTTKQILIRKIRAAKISPYAYPGVSIVLVDTNAEKIQIIKRVLDKHHNGITWELANIISRKRPFVMYRQHFIYLTCRYTDYTLNGVASFFDSPPDHSTVLHAKKNWQNLSETDRLSRKIHKSVIEDLNLLIK